MILADPRSRLYGPGQLFLSFCFPFCSSSPMCASITRDVVRGFTLCGLIPFLFFTLLTFLSFLSLSLALIHIALAVSGVGSCRGFRTGSPHDPFRSYEVTKWSRDVRLDVCSLFLSFYPFLFFHSVLHPLRTYQPHTLGQSVTISTSSLSDLVTFFNVTINLVLPSFFFTLMYTKPTEAGICYYLINTVK